MTTAAEFSQAGITGHTFREIVEKFGKPFNRIAEEDEVMSNYALGFAWLREREHLPIEEAFDKVMTMSVKGIMDFFEDGNDPAVKAAVDFASQPSTTTP